MSRIQHLPMTEQPVPDPLLEMGALKSSQKWYQHFSRADWLGRGDVLKMHLPSKRVVLTTECVFT